jgi:hypothetical protein
VGSGTSPLFQLASDVVVAEPGDLVNKPRDVWHIFWNATNEPARLPEIISPAGFEQLFVELANLLALRVTRSSAWGSWKTFGGPTMVLAACPTSTARTTSSPA